MTRPPTVIDCDGDAWVRDESLGGWVCTSNVSMRLTFAELVGLYGPLRDPITGGIVR